MTTFPKQTPTDNGRSQKTALVLVSTGSPASASPQEVRAFLTEMLSDPYVIDCAINRFLVNRLIIPWYHKKSAGKYRTLAITDHGFPLVYHTRHLAKNLSDRLHTVGIDCDVFYAMRYGSPDLYSLIEKLSKTHQRLCLLPLYPQYSQTTTESILAQTTAILNQQQADIAFDYLHDFYDTDEYIDALETQIRTHWHQHGVSGFLLFSFHAVPNHLTDGYTAQCEKTVGLLASRLQLKLGQYMIVYQSRFGYGKWSEPDLENTLANLAQAKQHQVDIICPGFVCDNLETRYDVDQKANALFLQQGGTALTRIDCLNANDFWVKRLAHLLDRTFDLPITAGKDAEAVRTGTLIPDIIDDTE